MPLLTDLTQDDIIKAKKKARSKKEDSKKTKKKLKALKIIKEKEQIKQEDRQRMARIEKILTDSEESIDMKGVNTKKIEELRKRERDREEEALKTVPSSMGGIAGEVLGKVSDIASGLFGKSEKKKRPFTKEGIAEELKETIDEIGQDKKDNPGFFTQLGRNVVTTYTDAGKGIIDTVAGTGKKEGEQIEFRQCDSTLVNNFDTLYLSCDRPNLISIYNKVVSNLKKRVNFFDDNVKSQILLLEPIEYIPEKIPQKVKEPLQTGGRKKSKKSKRWKKKSTD
jgi:hypothetical protein